MTLFLLVALTLPAVVGTVVVLTEVPGRQAVTYSFFGLTLVILFMALQAPDVALSQLGVGAAVVPLMIMLADRAMHRDRAEQEDEQ